MFAVLLGGCDWAFDLSRPGTDAGDAAVDASDGCWNVALTDDEDFDGDADGCDRCPSYPTAIDVDSDNDGILDECDPDGRAQHFVAFAGFATDNDPQGWTGGPTWAVRSGALGQNNEEQWREARLAIQATLSASIEAAIDLAPTPTGGSRAGVGLTIGGLDATCAYVYSDGDDLLFLTTGGDAGPQVQMPFNKSPGLRLRMWQTADGVVHCRAFDSVSSSDDLTSVALTSTTTTSALLVTASLVATFDWAMVIGENTP